MPRDTELRNGKTVADVVREYVPEATDDEIDFIMWNETGWPCFWHGDPEDSLRMSLARYASREIFADFSYFDCEHTLRGLNLA